MKTLEKATGSLIRFLSTYQNVVTGLIVGCFSVFMLTAAGKIAIDSTSSSPVDNAAFLPRMVFYLLIILSILFIVKGVKEIPAKREAAPSGETLEKLSKGTVRSFGALIMLAAYCFCFNKLGFVISSILYMVANMTYMTKKEARKPVAFVIIAVAMTLIVYFCFQKFLYIYLPNGILKGVF